MSSSNSAIEEKNDNAPPAPNEPLTINTEETTAIPSEKTTAPPGPPNGGFQAWLQVSGAFFLFFTPWALVNSFGTFQTYYEGHIPQSPSAISWVGTFQAFLLFLVGVLAGPIFDRGYCRTLIMVGIFFTFFGMMMTSISTQYYQIFLAQGVTVGLGFGCIFVPSVAIIARWFTTKRALATGIAAAGGSVGAVLYPIIFERLQPKVGFGWAVRVIAFISLATLLYALAVVKPIPGSSSGSRSLFDSTAFRNPAFIVYSISMFLFFIGLYFPFFYISAWAETNLGTTPSLAFYLFSLLNAGSFFGRIIPGLLADQFGSVNVLIPCLTITAILNFAWISIDSFSTLVVFCIFYGFFSGACVSLPPTIVAGIAPDMSKIGTWMGMTFIFAGCGLLIGNPIAGAILDGQGGSYVGAQCFSGATVMGGAVMTMILRYLKYKDGKGWKV